MPFRPPVSGRTAAAAFAARGGDFTFATVRAVGRVAATRGVPVERAGCGRDAFVVAAARLATTGFLTGAAAAFTTAFATGFRASLGAVAFAAFVAFAGACLATVFFTGAGFTAPGFAFDTGADFAPTLAAFGAAFATALAATFTAGFVAGFATDAFDGAGADAFDEAVGRGAAAARCGAREGDF